MLRVLVLTAPIPFSPADIEGQVEQNIAFLPSWLADAIAEYGLELALDLLIDLTKPSTGAYFYEELKGLADGSGTDHKQLERIHLIGELTQGDCSMVRTAGQGVGLCIHSPHALHPPPSPLPRLAHGARPLRALKQSSCALSTGCVGGEVHGRRSLCGSLQHVPCR